jgi:hypothetical protein
MRNHRRYCRNEQKMLVGILGEERPLARSSGEVNEIECEAVE